MPPPIDKAGTYDLLLQRGAPYEKDFRWRTSEGTIADLTGYTGIVTIWQEGVALTQPTFSIVGTPTDGIFRIRLEQADLDLLPTKGTTGKDVVRLGWDLTLVPPTGDPFRFLQGAALVSAGGYL